MGNNESSSKQSSILKELECVVCTNYLRPPIFVCQQGHSVCGDCKQKLSKCPSCQASYDSNARNYTLENVIQQLEYPCRYKENGCNVVNKTKDLKKHEENCKFRAILCPLHVDNGCTVKTTKELLEKHINSVHPNYFLQNYKDVELHYKLATMNWYKIICYNENIFKFYITFEKPLIRFSVRQMTESNEEDQYEYRFCINFVDQCANSKKQKCLSGSAFCYKLSSKEVDCLSFHIDQLKSFIDKNNDLIFKYTLEKI